jgi:hypothetical protein
MLLPQLNLLRRGAPSKNHERLLLRGADEDSESSLVSDSGSMPGCAAIDHNTLSCPDLLSAQNNTQHFMSCANLNLRSQRCLQRHGEPFWVNTALTRFLDVPAHAAALSSADCPVAEAERSTLADRFAVKGAWASHDDPSLTSSADPELTEGGALEDVSGMLQCGSVSSWWTYRGNGAGSATGSSSM